MAPPTPLPPHPPPPPSHFACAYAHSWRAHYTCVSPGATPAAQWAGRAGRGGPTGTSGRRAVFWVPPQPMRSPPIQHTEGPQTERKNKRPALAGPAAHVWHASPRGPLWLLPPAPHPWLPRPAHSPPACPPGAWRNRPCGGKAGGAAAAGMTGAGGAAVPFPTGLAAALARGAVAGRAAGGCRRRRGHGRAPARTGGRAGVQNGGPRPPRKESQTILILSLTRSAAAQWSLLCDASPPLRSPSFPHLPSLCPPQLTIPPPPSPSSSPRWRTR